MCGVVRAVANFHINVSVGLAFKTSHNTRISLRFLLKEKPPLKSLSHESLEPGADLGNRLIVMQGLCHDKRG